MKAERKVVESRRLTVSPLIIYSLIKAQAGTLAKAVLEAVMNSTDGGATRVDVVIKPTSIEIADDGRGFQTRAEIEECFEVFGFEHKEGERTYGQFGIGRAQLWNFCSTTWLTNNFQMDVDTMNKGLDYDLIENAPFVKGLTIKGKFYNRMKTSEILAFETELAELAHYAHIDVTINGRLVSRKVADEKWTTETDDAWIRIRESGDLTVYNQGILVRQYPAYMVGCGGVVVTKPSVRLSLNMARNDILMSECAVWKRIRPFLQKKADEAIRAKPTRLTEEAMRNLAYRFVAGEVKMEDLTKVRLITDVQGKNHTIEAFLRAVSAQRPVTVAPKGTALADRVHIHKLAFVLMPNTLYRFGVWNNDIQEFASKLKAALRLNRKAALLPDTVKFHADYRVAAPGLAEGHEIIHEKEYSPEEICVLKALSKAEYLIRSMVYRSQSGDAHLLERKLMIGVSASAIAWTDGATRIVFNRQALKKADDGLNGFVTLLNVMLHEYLHEEADTDTHVHDMQFYERYHNILTDGRCNRIGDAAVLALVQYAREMSKRGLLKHKTVKELDSLSHQYDISLIEDDAPEDAQPSASN